MKKIVIVGAGTAGTMMANKLRKSLIKKMNGKSPSLINTKPIIISRDFCSSLLEPIPKRM